MPKKIKKVLLQAERTSFSRPELILDHTPGFQPWPAPVYPPPQAPKGIVAGFEVVQEYRERFVISILVKAGDSLAGPEVTLSGLLRYQACTTEGACYPARYASFELKVPVAAKGSPVSRTNPEIFGSGTGNSSNSDGSALNRSNLLPRNSPPNTTAGDLAKLN